MDQDQSMDDAERDCINAKAKAVLVDEGSFFVTVRGEPK